MTNANKLRTLLKVTKVPKVKLMCPFLQIYLKMFVIMFVRIQFKLRILLYRPGALFRLSCVVKYNIDPIGVDGLRYGTHIRRTFLRQIGIGD